MASDAEIVRAMNNYLRTHGYMCGRVYADVPSVAEEIVASLPEESQQTLEPRIRRIAEIPEYGFKTRGDSVSASDPRCGS